MLAAASDSPLQNGDHLDQKTFHARYKASAEDFRAELIGGIVYLRDRRTIAHGRTQAKLCAWLGTYDDATPGTESLSSVTNILGPRTEPEPDGCLLILPEFGGQTWVDDDDYLNGAPEWIGEICETTDAIDLHAKKSDYEEAGVREYFVAALRTKQVFWFARRRGKFKAVSPGTDGILRSEVFPGLWLDPAAFLRRDYQQVLAVLRQGLASPEHAAFVAKLASKKA
jgi:hypothetical protein